MKKILCLLLALLMLFTICACAAKETEANTATEESTVSTEAPETQDESGTQAADPFGKFEPSIEITSMMLEDNIRNVPENMTMQSNPWVDLFKEHGMNVTYKISGSAADLDTKLKMAIATDDLPDIMQVTATQFQELSEAGYLADLTEVYETYATPETKAMFTQDGGIMMEDVMAGRCGIVVSHYCAPFDLLNAVTEGQQWAYYSVPSVDSEPVKAQFNLAFNGALCVSAKCEHPEAMIEMLNLFTKYVAENPETYNDNAVRNFAYPTITAAISGNNDIHKEYLEFLETGKTPAATTQG